MFNKLIILYLNHNDEHKFLLTLGILFKKNSLKFNMHALRRRRH